MSDNVSTEFKARELKSVYVEEKAEYLKFRLHPNYINNLNIYQQVGIVAINVLGEPTAQQQQQLLSTSTQQIPTTTHAPKTTTPMDDLAFDIHFDQETAGKIRQVHSAKAKAIEMEDYDTAKKLKVLEEKLKSSGLQIARLENQKREAVAHEDYDEAKRIKIEMDKLKQSLAAELYSIPILKGALPPPSTAVNNPVSLPPASPQKTVVSRAQVAPVVPPLEERPIRNITPEIPIEDRPITARSSVAGDEVVGQYPEPDEIVAPFEQEMHEWFGTPEWYTSEEEN